MDRSQEKGVRKQTDWSREKNELITLIQKGINYMDPLLILCGMKILYMAYKNLKANVV